jgi:hypothetical protein
MQYGLSKIKSRNRHNSESETKAWSLSILYIMMIIIAWPFLKRGYDSFTMNVY